MEDAKAKELLSAERSRVEGLLKDLGAEGTAVDFASAPNVRSIDAQLRVVEG